MRVAVLGLGATGSHVARQLGIAGLTQLSLYDTDRARQRQVIDALEIAEASAGQADGQGADVVILALPAGLHVAAAGRALDGGANVVSLSDRPEDVDGLLALAARASAVGRTVVVGAGFAPGLSCLLARHAGSLLDHVESISVAKTGTAGPACARQHHRALKRSGRDWVDGSWVLRRGGSGRDLAWFPDPVGAHDCYRAALPSPTLLHRLYPSAARISARISATRRDRFTSRLPMMRPPHTDGGPGAIRVEVRGSRNGAVETVVYGVIDHPSVAAATVAALSAIAVSEGRWKAGSFGLGEVDEPVELLRQLHDRGIRIATHEGFSA
jgi:saccharopine dehydrogenase-like NADP-dependent oxidoreductase